MDSSQITDHIVREGLIAIVRLGSADRLLDVARALAAGGVRTIEFTLTTPHALDTLEVASSAFEEDIVLGAGTVLDPETARAAILAGARFIVSPTLSRGTIEVCRRYGAAAIPGAYTPTEMLAAWEWGANLVKVFPAGNLGPKYIRDVLAPLGQLRLVPTGGVKLDNVAEFLRAGACAVAVGSNLVDPTAVAAEDFGSITSKAREFHNAVVAAREAS